MLLNYNDFGVTQIDNYSLIKVNTDVATEKYQKVIWLLLNIKTSST